MTPKRINWKLTIHVYDASFISQLPLSIIFPKASDAASASASTSQLVLA
jgi:hypothetical protein